jgi:hypothetical protein
MVDIKAACYSNIEIINLNDCFLVDALFIATFVLREDIAASFMKENL